MFFQKITKLARSTFLICNNSLKGIQRIFLLKTMFTVLKCNINQYCKFVTFAD